MTSGKISFTLNPKILLELPLQKYQKDFNFIVNGKKYPVPRLVADILSPIIRNLHYQDETIQEYYIDIKHQSQEDNLSNGQDHFSNFLDLCKCETVQLDEKEREIYSAYFYKLGNIDSYFKLHPEFISALDSENAIEFLTKIENIKNNFSITNSECIESIETVFSFIASHFDEIDKEELKKLPIETIEKIIGSGELKISEEDELLDFVLGLYQEDRKFSVLFEHVLFPNVSEEKLKLFVSEFCVEDINQRVWKSFCMCCFESDKNSLSEKEEKRYANRDKEFKMSEGKEFEGIMRNLTRETGGNIHDNGTIEITSNMIEGSDHPKNLVDYESDNRYFPSGNSKGAFACFDFKDKMVQLSSYSIRSCNENPNYYHLRNWAIEVSNDGQKWEEVDRHENEGKLNGRGFTGTFKISPENKEFYRFVRLIETGCCWHSNARYDGMFSMIEFFGKLKQPKNKK